MTFTQIIIYFISVSNLRTFPWIVHSQRNSSEAQLPVCEIYMIIIFDPADVIGIWSQFNNNLVKFFDDYIMTKSRTILAAECYTVLRLDAGIFHVARRRGADRNLKAHFCAALQIANQLCFGLRYFPAFLHDISTPSCGETWRHCALLYDLCGPNVYIDNFQGRIIFSIRHDNSSLVMRQDESQTWFSRELMASCLHTDGHMSLNQAAEWRLDAKDAAVNRTSLYHQYNVDVKTPINFTHIYVGGKRNLTEICQNWPRIARSAVYHLWFWEFTGRSWFFLIFYVNVTSVKHVYYYINCFRNAYCKRVF